MEAIVHTKLGQNWPVPLRRANLPTDRQTDRETDGLTDCLTDGRTDGLNDGLTE